MTALSQPRLTGQYAPGPVPTKLSFPVKGSTKIYAGSLVVLDAGYAKPATAALSLLCVGKANETVDNSAGSSGDLSIDVLPGVFLFENGDSIAQADVGKPAYAVDDQTVAKGSGGGARSVAGTILGLFNNQIAVLVGMGIGSGGFLSHTRSYVMRKLVDGSASAATAESSFARADQAGTVIGLYFVPDAALTADDTNYATLTVKTRDGAGGAASTVASVTTKITGGSGDWTAFVPVSLGTLSNAALAAGALLTFTIAKSGTGVAVPAGQVVAVFQTA